MQATSAFIICAIFAFFAVSVEGASRSLCQTNDDCKGATSCCVKLQIIQAKQGFCSVATEEDDLCDPQAQSPDSDNFYRFTCPCAAGLTCQEREVTWGTTKYTVHKCLP